MKEKVLFSVFKVIFKTAQDIGEINADSDMDRILTWESPVDSNNSVCEEAQQNIFDNS